MIDSLHNNNKKSVFRFIDIFFLSNSPRHMCVYLDFHHHHMTRKKSNKIKSKTPKQKNRLIGLLK